jgi:hypothetical protein
MTLRERATVTDNHGKEQRIVDTGRMSALQNLEGFDGIACVCVSADQPQETLLR